MKILLLGEFSAYFSNLKDGLVHLGHDVDMINSGDSWKKIESNQVVVLDVREPDEFEQGALKNVVHIPRGHLEAQVESIECFQLSLLYDFELSDLHRPRQFQFQVA